MNTYPTSSGERVSKSTIDYRVRKAKKEKLEEQFMEHGYNFCTEPGCGNNGNNTFLDVSHEESVNECQNSGHVEKAWDKDNMKIRCRACHNVKDQTNLQFNTKVA